MTDNEIINKFNSFLRERCNDCPFKTCYDCEILVGRYALDLINRQQAEIERLNGCVKSEDEVRAIMKAQMEPMVKEVTNELIDRAVKVAKADATIEFVDKLKKSGSCMSIFVDGEEKVSSRVYQISETELDNLVLERLCDVK